MLIESFAKFFSQKISVFSVNLLKLTEKKTDFLKDVTNFHIKTSKIREINNFCKDTDTNIKTNENNIKTLHVITIWYFRCTILTLPGIELNRLAYGMSLRIPIVGWIVRWIFFPNPSY